MTRWLFNKLGPHYIFWMMVFTRIVGGTCGGLVILYVNFTIPLPPEYHFDRVAAIVVLWTLGVTVVVAQWETRDLRATLRQLWNGKTPDPAQASRAGRQAVIFPVRHHFLEALIVPVNSCLPLCLFMAIVARAPVYVVVQIILTAFMGTSVVLLTTFFTSERWMAHVTRYLLDHKVVIPFDDLPTNKLHVRLNVCFSITIVVTAIMIGALANQRAMDIIRYPDRKEEVVANLRYHVNFIMLAAVATGFAFSRLLSSSVASRVQTIVAAMRRVEQRDYSQPVLPTGNDEIDILARRFNEMVGTLEQNDHTIRDLNANLEQKVKRRTRQLSKSRVTLKRSLAKLQEYDRLKTQFFSNISHEVRTPLTMILTPVERLLEKQRADAAQSGREPAGDGRAEQPAAAGADQPAVGLLQAGSRPDEAGPDGGRDQSPGRQPAGGRHTAGRAARHRAGRRPAIPRSPSWQPTKRRSTPSSATCFPMPSSSRPPAAV